ncbi:MAG: AI-2E family transporter [Nocardioidaceae bacterium]|nr:AI-2E family transporter [Nocardioidaceae bacterium]MCL2612012.1 AI-2E family transporter [Nocardioidaceae bacterium]
MSDDTGEHPADPQPDVQPDTEPDLQPDEAADPVEDPEREEAVRKEVAEADRRERYLIGRFAQLWHMRERDQPVDLGTGPSDLRPAAVPYGLDLAAAWSWRLLIIGFGGYVLLRLAGYFAVVTVPLAIAMLFSALAAPSVGRLERLRIPRGLAALLVVVFGLAVVVALLTFAGQQVANGAQDLTDSTVKGLGEIRGWLKDGPLHASNSQINHWIQRAQDSLRTQSEGGKIVGRVTEVGSALGHVLAGFFITLFSTYFFLADGRRIWAWLVRIAPRGARERVDSSGRVAWLSLVQFVRATVIVALVDAVGVALGAAILKVPFVLAIGVLVFLGAFVPMIGATIAGTVAVLVALVDHGPVTAALMLAVVIVVQQVEGHVLQPFLMGRWVSLHPLGVIVAIASGVLVAGVAGALVAVPLAAAGNAVVLHLADLASVDAEKEKGEASAGG